MENSDFNIKDVIARDMCIGCGVCSIACAGKISVDLGDDGLYRASIPSDVAISELADTVCPFSNRTPNENIVGEALFHKLPYDRNIGRYRGLYAGRVANDNYIVGSSSGGLTTWLLKELLTTQRVDGVVHVAPTGTPGHLFTYTISYSPEELDARRKSRYAPVTLAGVLEKLRGNHHTYAVVGVPCFVTALRHLIREVPAYGETISYIFGLVCGHGKGEMYAESLGWQAGIKPNELASLDFRVKSAANDKFYNVTATSLSGVTKSLADGVAFDTNWGVGAFMANACNYCDDVVAETADITFGDAWLPRYISDPRGTNMVITRNSVLDKLLNEGAARGELSLDPLTISDIVTAQAGGFRHRRVGLTVRLADDEKLGLKIPAKRVAPGYTGVSETRIKLIRNRVRLSRQSFADFAAARTGDNFEIYRRSMQKTISSFERRDRLDKARAIVLARIRILTRRAFRLLRNRV